MYYDTKHERVLLRDGTSIVSSWHYSQLVLAGESVDGLYVIADDHVDAYKKLYGLSVGADIEDVHVAPTVSHIASVEEHNDVMERISLSPRLISRDIYLSRVEEEMQFFSDTNNIVFLKKCVELVDKMKRDGVVWGVGRGSCCASLVLYLLYITDIDPVLYDIPFSELSKQHAQSKWE